MVVDYKTLQAIVAGQPPDTDAYCPECGRPWRDPSPERSQPVMLFPWRAVFLAVIGLAPGNRLWRAGRAGAPDGADGSE
jgi:hypothetical protein